MSTNALVRTAWADNVFANLNAGKNSYQRLLAPTSQDEIALGYDEETKRIYFWEYIVSSLQHFPYIGGGVNVRKVDFKVEITHWQQRNTQNNPAEDSSMSDVLDAFQTLAGYVRTNLGHTWDSTVDFFETPSEVEIEAAEFDGKPCWKAKQIYKAIKTISS